jgi:hypothetical protein
MCTAVLQTYIVDAANVSERWSLSASEPLPHRRSGQCSIASPPSATPARRTTSISTGRSFMSAGHGQRTGADGSTYHEAQNISQLWFWTPDLYTDWLHEAPLKIRWDSFGNAAAAPVKIDLYQDGPNGPAFLNDRATAQDTASTSGLPPTTTSTTARRTENRVSIVQQTISDRSTEIHGSEHEHVLCEQRQHDERRIHVG